MLVLNLENNDINNKVGNDWHVRVSFRHTRTFPDLYFSGFMSFLHSFACVHTVAIPLLYLTHVFRFLLFVHFCCIFTSRISAFPAYPKFGLRKATEPGPVCASFLSHRMCEGIMALYLNHNPVRPHMKVYTA